MIIERDGMEMVNTDVFKINIDKEKTSLRQYGITDREFEEKKRS